LRLRSTAKDRSTGVKLRRVFAAALVVLAAGCSSVRIGYNNADTFLLYTLDNYLDLSGQQQQLVRDRLRTLLAWHRATQLRGSTDVSDGASKRLESRVSGEEIYALNLEMNRRLVLIGDQAAPDLAALALTLRQTQLDRFARKLAEDDAKVRREAARKGSLEQRLKRSVERTEEWFGSVSPRQLELIRNELATRPDSEDWWLHEREQRRADLLKVLQRIHTEQPTEHEAARWLREYFARIAEPQEPERRTRMTEFRHGNAELIAALINASSAEQKAVLVKKLHGYAEDFATLAAATGRG
jgi:hypothetical protein